MKYLTFPMALLIVTGISLGVAIGDGKKPRAITADKKTQVVATKAVGPSRQDVLRASIEDKTRDRGYVIHPHPKASGKPLDIQRRIAEQFSSQKPVPGPGRSAYFRNFASETTRINGWYGSIAEVVEDGDRLLIKVIISPYLSSARGAVTFTNDSYTEIFEMSGGVLRSLGGEATDHGPKFLIVD